MKKRGQVSTFLILGLVLVVVAAFGIYYRAELMSAISQLPLFRVALPPEAEEVQKFVHDCLEATTIEAAELVGLQGGYIDLPADIIPQGNVNLFSNKLNAYGDLRVMYWFYQQSNGIEVQKIPTLTEMESYIEAYVDANIEECLDNFSVFEKYQISYRTPKSKIDLRDNAIQAYLVMPLAMSFDENRFNFQTFKLSLKLGLGKLYKIAKDLIANEIRTNFLEEKTIDMMVAYDDIPLSGMDLSCAPKIWRLGTVTSNFKRIIADNIPQVRVAKTNYELAEDYKTYFEWPVTRTAYKDVTANLLYAESWPFYIDVTPSEDGIMKSQQIAEDMGDVAALAKSLFCMNQYHFVYDVKYPVLIMLTDDSTGYTLQFAIEVVVERNQPRKAEAIPESIPQEDQKYCKNTKFARSTVYTYSEDLNDNILPLDEVRIKYKCINHVCDVGTSRLIEDEAYLSTEFPACIGGTLIGTKEGYHKAQEVNVDTNEGVSTSLVLEPYSIKKVKVEVLPRGGAPQGDEQVIIELLEEEKEYSTILLHPEEKELKLVPGHYKIKEYIIKSGGTIVIPSQNIETCADVPKGTLGVIFGLTEPKCVTQKIPETTLDQIVLGGSEFELDITKDDLKSDYIKFYIKANPTPTSLEELGKISLQEEVLLPVFLNE